jgi:hypothetical protein
MAAHLPELGTNLVATLASLDVHDLTHLCKALCRLDPAAKQCNKRLQG